MSGAEDSRHFVGKGNLTVPFHTNYEASPCSDNSLLSLTTVDHIRQTNCYMFFLLTAEVVGRGFSRIFLSLHLTAWFVPQPAAPSD